MTVHFGLELTPSRCTLVTAQPARDDVRVLAFDSIAAGSTDGAELRRALKSRLADKPCPEPVHAVIWGARSLCLALPIDPRDTADVQGRVLQAAAEASPDFHAWSTDAWIHLSLSPPGTDGRRLAFLVAASGRDLRRRVRPLERAGLRIGQISTPAMALALLSQIRRGDAPGAVTAYVALNHDGGCVAVERDGRLLYGGDLSWAGRSQRGQIASDLLERYTFVARLIPGLRRAFDVVRRTHGCAVEQVITCGDLPELRSFTMPLIEELDMEVETLDSLAGIDVEHLPQPRDVFRDQVASLRLACIVAAAEPTMELAPVARQGSRAPRVLAWGMGGLAVAAALVAGVALWPGTPPSAPAATPAVRTASALEEPVMREPTADGTATGALPPDGTPSSEVERPARDAAASDLATSSVGRLPPPASAPTSLRQAGGSGGQVETRAAVDSSAEPLPEAGREPTPRPVPRRPSTADAAPSAPATAIAPVAPAPRPRGPDRRPAREPVVASILYSAESRLAVVDGRVVGVGDAVGDARIVDITRDEVVVRLSSGATRRWPMRSAGASGERE